MRLSTKQRWVGARFGRLVIKDVFRKGQETWAICDCDCGNEHSGLALRIRRGETKSCGCFRREATAARNKETKTHGMTHSRLYSVWIDIKKRCLCTSSRDYFRYGGRGIIVAPEWVADFVQFAADVGEPPSSQHSLDRIDNDGPYSKANCRWATKVMQTRNRSVTVTVEHNGRRLPLAAWAEETGIKYSTLYTRLRSGLPPWRVLAPLQVR